MIHSKCGITENNFKNLPFVYVPRLEWAGFILILIFCNTVRLYAQKDKTVITHMTALQAYRDGFIHDVMKASSHKGVRLNNFVLFENDGPGAGLSEKGPYLEHIYKGNLARKQFYIKDPRAVNATIVFYMMEHNPNKPKYANFGSDGKHAPYYIIVNGIRVPGDDPSWHEPAWRWVEIPVTLLKRGLNEIIIGCDGHEEKGYDLLFAREDEYAGGGGKYTYMHNTAMISADQIRPESGEGGDKLKPIDVGGTSAKSVDGGKTWIKGGLGPKNNISGEYTIRLQLQRFKPKGTLASPPIDLWADQQNYSISPKSKIKNLEMHVNAFIPDKTEIIWQYRTSDTNDMKEAKAWGGWKTMGRDTTVSLGLDSMDRRYLQWRAVLKTETPLLSPIIHNVDITRTLSPESTPEDTYYIVESENVQLRYSSYRITYENAQNSVLKSIRRRLNLDSLLVNSINSGVSSLKKMDKDARIINDQPSSEGMTSRERILVEDQGGNFAKVNRVRHYISSLWNHHMPFPNYPAWNANDILDRNERQGAGGMCIQFSIVFMQALQSLGYNARHVNQFAHEIIETYVNELGKYVLIDPESLFDYYEFNSKTGEPFNALEQHKLFLKKYGFSAQNPIEWQDPNTWAGQSKKVEQFKQATNFSTFKDNENEETPPPLHDLAGFLRWETRTDFLSRPFPRPLTQGGIQWPWDGYVNWYDAATPRKKQYALHTDRVADMYPTLNQVQFAATYGNKEGEINIRMITNTPNFDTFEINIDGRGWQASSDEFTWKLRPAALNTLKMRTRNLLGVTGKSSKIKLFWHFRGTYQSLKKSGESNNSEK